MCNISGPSPLRGAGRPGGSHGHVLCGGLGGIAGNMKTAYGRYGDLQSDFLCIYIYIFIYLHK